MKPITRKVRADYGASVVVTGVPMKKAYTRAQRQSRVTVSIIYAAAHSATSVVVTRTRAREIRDALDRVLGDE